jgi:hypothetical protein
VWNSWHVIGRIDDFKSNKYERIANSYVTVL